MGEGGGGRWVEGGGWGVSGWRVGGTHQAGHMLLTLRYGPFDAYY